MIEQNTENQSTENTETQQEEAIFNESASVESDKEEVSDESSAIETIKKELEEQKDKYLRLYSEFDNYKRRTAKEKIELSQIANKDIVIALLPVLDDCERAQKSIGEASDVTAVKEGLNLVFNKLFKSLESKGLKPLESIGQVFDSELHEAITQIPSPSPELKGKVVDEVEKGYFLNDKLIRFAKVVTGA